jgi:glycosyltransferase involved in cell wall biosynthesis
MPAITPVSSRERAGLSRDSLAMTLQCKASTIRISLQKMKILHVLNSLSPSHGGPVSVIQGLAVAQAKLGHIVDVLSTGIGSPLGDSDAILNSFHYSRGVRWYFASYQFRSLLLSNSVRSFLRRHGRSYDIIEIHGLYRFPVTYSAWFARTMHIPYVIRPHGSLDPFLYSKSTTRNLPLKRIYEYLFDLPNLHSAGAIHFTASDERNRASFLDLRAPSFVCPNGIDLECYEHLPVRGRLRSKWGLGDDPIVLFLGRLHFKKGLDLLIPAFSQLLRHQSNLQLVIAGPDNDNYSVDVRAWVREHGVSESVHIVGNLDGPDITQAYVDSDVFVLPSYTENFGMTVVEAMACGLPVVISDQVNIHSEISRVGAGIVVPCDAIQIAHALKSVLVDSLSRQTMGKAGRDLVSSRFSWPSIAKSLINEYETVISRS